LAVVCILGNIFHLAFINGENQDIVTKDPSLRMPREPRVYLGQETFQGTFFWSRNVYKMQILIKGSFPDLRKLPLIKELFKVNL